MPDIRDLPPGHAPIHLWNPFTGEYDAVAVPVPDQPARKRRTRKTSAPRRPGRPVSWEGLSNGSPFTESMSDTAYADMGPLADMRRMSRKPPTIKTRRPAVVWPEGKASDSAAGTRWHDLGR